MVGLASVTALAAMAGVAEAQSVKGTVVHRNAPAGSFVVAQHDGRLAAIHARHIPRVGSVVVVSVRRLHNGTFAAKRIRSNGRARRVRVKGTVSYVNRSADFFTLSSPGVSMLVREKRGHAARSAAALPAVGTNLTATGTVDSQGDLEDQSLQSDGPDTTNLSVEGVVLAVNTQAGTLSISADDSEQSNAAITVTVPAGLSLAQFTVGQDVELQVTLQPNGSYVLAGSASDQGVQGADDQGEQQGSQGDNNQGDQQTATQTGSDTAAKTGTDG